MDLTTQRFMMGASAGGEDYWISLVNNTLGYNFTTIGFDLDSSDNFYLSGYVFDGWYRGFLIKLDPDGSALWTKRVSNNIGYPIVGRDCLVDSAGNIFLTGYYDPNGTQNNALLVKYDTNGNLIFDRGFGYGGNTIGQSISKDSSNNIYLTGVTQGGSFGVNDVFLVAINQTVPSVIGQRNFGTARNENGYASAIDSSGNIYIAGATRDSSNVKWQAYIYKYNSSFNPQTYTAVQLATADSALFYDLYLDSSANLVCVGVVQPSGASTPYIAKFDSSGNLLWQRTTLPSGGGEFSQVYVDAATNDIYATGYCILGGYQAILLCKYNSSGSLQWSRSIATAGYTTFSARGPRLTSTDSLCIPGYTTYNSTYNTPVLIKIPTDGSLTGTYGGFSYASISVTDSAGTLTTLSPTFSSGGLTHTFYDPTFTAGIYALSTTVTPI